MISDTADTTTASEQQKGHDERTLRARFWRKLRRVGRALPFTEDLLAAYYCAFDRETPLHVKTALVGALAYFVLPFDAMPDLLPILGFTDDAAALAAALRLIAGNIQPYHRDAARRALARDFAEPGEPGTEVDKV